MASAMTSVVAVAACGGLAGAAAPGRGLNARASGAMGGRCRAVMMPPRGVSSGGKAVGLVIRAVDDDAEEGANRRSRVSQGLNGPESSPSVSTYLPSNGRASLSNKPIHPNSRPWRPSCC
jgi:hypothetical protein